MRSVLLSVAALLSVSLSLSAQSVDTVARHLTRADSLFSAGDLAGARIAFEAVLAADPDNSRALFQLARTLEAGSPRAIELLGRYTILESEDAWGFGALAEALGSSGDLTGAAAAYLDALSREPGEREFELGLAVVLGRDGHTDEAIRRYYAWIEHHPNDAAAMRQLAELLRRELRPRAAAAILARSLSIEQDQAASARLRALRMELAPSVEPSARANRDSDGNLVISTRMKVESRVADGLRVGVTGGWLQSEDSYLATTGWEGLLHGIWQPARDGFLEGEMGLVSLSGGEIGQGSIRESMVRLRARWRPTGGPAADLRLRREPVSATPLLLGTPVILSEFRGVADLPLHGPLVARAVARVGRLQAERDTNSRIGFGGGGVLRLDGSSEVGALFQRTRFGAPTDAPYFAPEQVDAIELTFYTESYRAWPLTFALDAGAGAERITPWGGQTGDWAPAFRLWTLLSWTLDPGRELRLEADSYDSRVGAALAPAGEGWRWGSLGLSFRTAIR